MSAVERWLCALLVLIGVIVAGDIALKHYGTEHYDAGYAAAVEIGKKQRDREALINQQAEAELRATLAAKDNEAKEKERTYEISLEVAQRRLRTGSDSLRCPTAGPVQPAAAAADRSVTSGPAVDDQGPAIVPDAAADLLGIAADVAGLVRRYDRVVERFEACRALNAVP